MLDKLSQMQLNWFDQIHPKLRLRRHFAIFAAGEASSALIHQQIPKFKQNHQLISIGITTLASLHRVSISFAKRMGDFRSPWDESTLQHTVSSLDLAFGHDRDPTLNYPMTLTDLLVAAALTTLAGFISPMWGRVLLSWTVLVWVLRNVVGVVEEVINACLASALAVFVTYSLLKYSKVK